MLYVIPDALLKVSLNTNKLVTMLYVIPETLLKMSLNTNKIGHRVLPVRYPWNIVESIIKH